MVFDDRNELIKLFDQEKKDGFKNIYYYVRVEQVDGKLAWSSPVWFEIPV